MGDSIFRGGLTDEQLRVFRQVLDGRTGRQIAETLNCTPEHVERLIARTCRQLQVSRRRDAGRVIAVHHGWDLPTAQLGPQAVAEQHVVKWRQNTKGAETDRTERERIRRPVYRTSTGNRTSVSTNGPPVDEIGANPGGKGLLAHPLIGRAMLLALVIAASAFALSTLIAALQGLDRLVSS